MGLILVSNVDVEIEMVTIEQFNIISEKLIIALGKSKFQYKFREINAGVYLSSFILNYFFQNPFNFPILFFISSMEGEDEMVWLEIVKL